jgi:hypothetical protein
MVSNKRSYESNCEIDKKQAMTLKLTRSMGPSIIKYINNDYQKNET